MDEPAEGTHGWLVSRLSERAASDASYRGNTLAYRSGRLLAPLARVPFVQDYVHKGAYRRHALCDKLLELVRKIFYWRSTFGDVMKNRCPDCLMSKRPAHRVRSDLQRIKILGRPYAQWQVDEMEGFSLSHDGYDSFLTCVDMFTKFAVLMPISKSMNAEQVADLFYRHVCLQFGAPAAIHTDLGSRYTSNHWQEFAKVLGCEHRTPIAWHPESHGMVERLNRTVMECLVTVAYKDPRGWTKKLPLVAFGYNNYKHRAHGFTPFLLTHACHPNDPLKPRNDGQTPQRWGVESHMFQEVLEVVKPRIARSHHRSKEYADRSRDTTRAQQFEAGDLVRLRAQTMKGRKLPKMQCPFTRPLFVAEVLRKGTVRLHLPEGHQFAKDTFNVSELEPYDAPIIQESEIGNEEEQFKMSRLLVRDQKTVPPPYCVRWEGDKGRDAVEMVEADLGRSQAQLDEYERIAGPILEINHPKDPQRLRRIASYKKRQYGERSPLMRDSWTLSHPMRLWARTTRLSKKDVPASANDAITLASRLAVIHSNGSGWKVGVLQKSMSSGHSMMPKDGNKVSLSHEEALQGVQLHGRLMAVE
eukprot:scaffold7_cov414-Pavlova_lutheri.AAC.17